jgi:hypothetical protein
VQPGKRLASRNQLTHFAKVNTMIRRYLVKGISRLN